MYEPQEIHFRAASFNKNRNDSFDKNSKQKLSFKVDEEIDF
jgi:hypothetical protein